MLRALCLAAFFGLTSGSVHHHDDDIFHECIHDRIQTQANVQEVFTEYENHPFDKLSESSRFKEQGTVTYTSTVFQPMRIILDLTRLTLANDAPFVCGSAGQTISGNPSEGGAGRVCGTNDVATPEKLSFLANTLLPAAVSYFNQALNVIPVSGNLRLDPFANCIGVPVNQAFTTGTGVGPADFHLTVTVRPTSGNTLAFAGFCMVDQFRRPIAGMANFGSNTITPGVNVDGQIATAIHEIAHALGWSNGAFQNFRDINTGLVRTVVTQTFNERGGTVTKLVTPNILAKAREQFACADLNGCELENQGGSGTAGSHLEKRIFANEGMTGSLGSNAVFSATFLALFQDSGWYTVDFARAATLAFGRNLGCTVAREKCNIWPANAIAAGAFCGAPSNVECTGDLLESKGNCNFATFSAALDPQFQYFANPAQGGGDQLADFCPRLQAFSNGDCRVATNSPTQAAVFGENYLATSRCFKSTILQNGFSPNTLRALCYPVRCGDVGGQPVVFVTVGGVEKQCTVGGTLSFTGFTGVVNCPDPNLMCPIGNVDVLCPNNCNGRGTCSAGVCSCNVGFIGADCGVAATQAPTRAPTLAPTRAPTLAPTLAPTRAPTLAPTRAPTLSPTLAPTVAGVTKAPTVPPTNAPTTTAPTLAPTSLAPTRAPTLAPTLAPTRAPTKAPTTRNNLINNNDNLQGIAVASGETLTFTTAVQILPSQTVTVTLTPAAGTNADLFVKFGSVASTTNFDQKSDNGGIGGAEQIVVLPQATRLAQLLEIAVVGVSASTFSISLVITNPSCTGVVCQNGGTCNANTGLCVCQTGFEGVLCEQLNCPGTPNCLNHGTCVSVGGTPTCSCFQDFSGSDCSVFTPPVVGQDVTGGGSRIVTDLLPNNIKIFSLAVRPQDAVVVVTFTKDACTDSASFRDAVLQESCAGWTGFDCSNGNRLNAAQSAALVAACPKACFKCPGSGLMLMARFDAEPLINNGTAVYNALDQDSFSRNAAVHSLRIDLTTLKSVSVLHLGLFNNGAFASGSSVGGVITVQTFTASGAFASCNPVTSCSGQGRCGLTGLCICETGFFGANCAIQLTRMAGVINTTVTGTQRKIYNYASGANSFFTARLVVTPVIPAGRAPDVAAGSAGAVHPRLYVQRAPSLPGPDYNAFADWDAIAANKAVHTVRTDVRNQPASLWYITVENAAGSGVMSYSLTIDKEQNGLITSGPFCAEANSAQCTSRPTLTCPTANERISDIVRVEYSSSQLVTAAPFLACADAAAVAQGLVADSPRLCHDFVCPEAQACLGLNSCTIADCTRSANFIATCNPSNGAPGSPCGFQVLFNCRQVVSTACSPTPCGNNGNCLVVNSAPSCSCRNGFSGADCKTGITFSQQIGVPNAAVSAQQFPAAVTTDTNPAFAPAVNGTKAGVPGFVFAIIAVVVLGLIAGVIAAVCLIRRNSLGDKASVAPKSAEPTGMTTVNPALNVKVVDDDNHFN